MAKAYKVKLLRKEKLAKDTWLFAFSSKGRSSSGREEPIIYIPGQYMTYTLVLPNGKKDWRDMTITSSPQQNELWLVTKIRKEPSLFKKILLNLSLGSLIQVEGPSGGFTVRDETKPHVFLAGGIGVNVFHSMLQDAAESNSNIPITLLASFSKREDIVFYKELKQLEDGNKKIIYTLTDARFWTQLHQGYDGQASQNDSFEKGRITEKMIRKYISRFYDAIFMIAGGQEFVDTMNEMLLAIGVPLEHIRIDYFTGY